VSDFGDHLGGHDSANWEATIVPVDRCTCRPSSINTEIHLEVAIRQVQRCS